MSEAGDAVKRLFRELSEINKKSVFDDEATIALQGDSPFRLRVLLTPKSGPYAGGAFRFLMVLPQSYPNAAPKVTCQQKVYHPNIDNGRVCFSMLTSDFSTSYRVEHFVNGLLYLLQCPNLESRLNGNVDDRDFEAKVLRSMCGETINGMHYPKCLTRDLTPAELYMQAIREPNGLALLHLPAGASSLEVPVAQLTAEQRAEIVELVPRLAEALSAVEGMSLVVTAGAQMAVARRAARLRVPVECVLKDLIFVTEQRTPVLALSNGADLINPFAVADAIGAPVRKYSRNEMLAAQIDVLNTAVFSPAAHIVVSQRVLDHTEPLYIGTGVARMLLKLPNGRALLALVPGAKIADLNTPFAAPLAPTEPLVEPAPAPAPAPAPVAAPEAAPAPAPALAPAPAPTPAPALQTERVRGALRRVVSTDAEPEAAEAGAAATPTTTSTATTTMGQALKDQMTQLAARVDAVMGLVRTYTG